MKTLEQYKADAGRPGKFEGASPLAVFLLDESMDGNGEILADLETDGHFAAKFELTGSEREAFQTNERDWVLIEDSQGFVFAIPAGDYPHWKGYE